MEFGGNVTVGLESIGNFGANKELCMEISMAKLQGISEMALTSDSTLRGDAASNPTELSYFHVQLWNAAGVTTTSNAYAILEQRVIFMEPRDATLSLGRHAGRNTEVVDEKEDPEEFITIPVKGLANAVRIRNNSTRPVAMYLNDLKIEDKGG